MADGNGGPLHGLAGYLSEIDLQDDELDRLRAEYMNACKNPRGHIRDIKASAREAGINMKGFAVVLAEHRDIRRHEKRVAGLELDDQAAYEEMAQKLGAYADTPLGAAAMARAKPKEDTLDSLQG